MSTEAFDLGFDCVPSFSSGEVVSKRVRVQSRSSECEPEGNLDGFLARLHAFPQNEGKAVLRGTGCKGVATTMSVGQKVSSLQSPTDLHFRTETGYLTCAEKDLYP